MRLKSLATQGHFGTVTITDPAPEVSVDDNSIEVEVAEYEYTVSLDD